jgi:hypothetical protein
MTITEAMIGMLVLAVAVGGALQATSVARRESILADERAIARSILGGVALPLEALPYADPTAAPGAIGPEAGESLTGPAHWDDLDDAHGWSGTPPFASGAGWSASIAVVWVNPTDPTDVRTLESGLKRITITVRRGERVILQEVRFRGRI